MPFLFLLKKISLEQDLNIHLLSHIISFSDRGLMLLVLTVLFLVKTMPCFASLVKTMGPRLLKSVVLITFSFHLTLWKLFTPVSIVGSNCLAKCVSGVSWPHNNFSMLADWHRTSISVGQGRWCHHCCTSLMNNGSLEWISWSLTDI